MITAKMLHIKSGDVDIGLNGSFRYILRNKTNKDKGGCIESIER